MKDYIVNILTGVRQWVNSKLDDMSFVISSHINDLSQNKQDVISDLDDIRSGAAAGAAVPAWAKSPNKPSYTAAEVGALPDTTVIPSKTSQLTNDSGFLTAHQSIKTLAGETLVGSGNVSLKTVGGQSLIGSGDIVVQASGVYQDPTTKEVYVEGIGGYDGTNPESSQSLEKYLEGVFRNISSQINELASRVEALEQQ